MTTDPNAPYKRPLETILGDCARCRLPVYASDAHRNTSIPPGSYTRLFHTGCSMAEEGEFWERQVKGDVERLRGCGYVVELRLVRPVR
jgi:hypothetical protein